MAAPPTTDETAGRLKALRDRLDVVDTSIHRLLRERFEIVEEIGAAKGPDEPVIRPAREAAVIENRLALHKGAMPPDMLAHIWRVVMSAACMVQRPFTVHTFGAPDVAAFLYGPVPLIAHSSAERAVRALSPGDVAVLHGDDGWWRAAREVGAHGLLRVPLEGGEALVVGGPNVAPGAGPDAVLVRDETLQILPASAITADDIVLGRPHTFPMKLPTAKIAP